MTAQQPDKALKQPSRFTVRIYGILIREGKILLSHERIDDFNFTKFPGGGLEFGEGPKDCLIREFREETGFGVNIIAHLYTSDFFIQSRFAPEEQVIGIYYMVSANAELNISGRQLTQPFRNTTNRISHSWMAVEELKEDMLTFEMDRAALRVLNDQLSSRGGNS